MSDKFESTATFELDEPVVVEDSFLGERFRFEHAAGTVVPKSELEEAALERLAEDQPKVCRRVKRAAKAKG